MVVGVLALQGAFREHRLVLERLGAEVREVRLPKHLDGLAGVVIPGGESTTMMKLIKAYDLDTSLAKFYGEGGAVWGTCAGAIAIASDVIAYPEQPRLGLMNIGIERNAYGRQVDSFEVEVEVDGFERPFPTIFIRAPRIAWVSPELKVLASFADYPIMVEGKRLLATVFHPELSGDDRVHAYFIEHIVRGGL